MVRFEVRLTDEQLAGLKLQAREQGVSVSEIVRRYVDKGLKDGYAPSREELWDRALSVVGAFRSGLTDVARRHDDYLVEAYMSDIDSARRR
jgi:predicted double-glycine peptidase